MSMLTILVMITVVIPEFTLRKMGDKDRRPYYTSPTTEYKSMQNMYHV